MIEEDQRCVDVLKGSHAVKRALDKSDQFLLAGDLTGCFPVGIRERRAE